jgi:hypothetical protein
MKTPPAAPFAGRHDNLSAGPACGQGAARGDRDEMGRRFAMQHVSSPRQWREFEGGRWLRAVRDRGLHMRSLDDERQLVFEAINVDLERRKYGREIPKAS